MRAKTVYPETATFVRKGDQGSEPNRAGTVDRCAPGTGQSAPGVGSGLIYLGEHASQMLRPVDRAAAEIESGASLYRNVAGCIMFQVETGA
jgi:hypothetical protein